MRRDQLQRLWNLDNRRCCRCYGNVVLAEESGEAVIRCMECGSTAGHVSLAYVEYQMMKDNQYAQEAARNYPEFAGAEGMHVTTAAEAAQHANALFGGGFSEEYFRKTIPEKTLPAGYIENPTGGTQCQSKD